MSKGQKTFGKWRVSATAIIGALGLSGLMSSAVFAGDADKGVRIGLALYSQLQARWHFDAALFKQEAEKNGDTVIIEFADGDPSKQTAQVQSMISRGIDVLAIASANVQIGGNLIDQAKAEGIKTIAYDIAVEGAAPDWMVTRKQEEVGKLQVEAALRFAPKGNYAVLNGDPANDMSRINDPVYTQMLAAHPDIKVVYHDWIPGFDPATAQSVTEDLLTRYHDDIKAFVVIADGLAKAVISALDASGLGGKVFVSGIDAEQSNLNLVARGLQTMTLYTPLDELARSAADAAHELGNGRDPKFDRKVETKWGEVPAREVSVLPVTRDNLCDFVTRVAPKGWADIKAVTNGSDVKCP